MSDNYFGPLVLPEKGEDLLEGYQYLLTPLARDMLSNIYGYRGLPTVVECIRRRVAATCIRSLTENLETGEQRWTVMDLDHQDATFRVRTGGLRPIIFTIDLAEMARRAPVYMETHKIPDSLIDNWEEETRKYPLNLRFRGCTWRWWAQGAPLTSTYVPRKKGDPLRKREKIDLSCLD